MNNFKTWLDESISATADKSHYTHLEDILITDGAKGIPKIMVSLIDLVKGIPTTQVDTKIDGSPSVFFGLKDGKFFVATKSIFNVDPKINFTNSDIEKNHGHAPGLVEKLKSALKYLPGIYNSTEILQGDFMYSPGEVKTAIIAGQPHFVFQPNTVINAIPVDSDLGMKIKPSTIGFATHTKYTADGKRVQIQSSDVKRSKFVFEMPVSAPTLKEYGHLQSDIDSVRKALGGLSRPGLAIMTEPVVQGLYMVYKNATVRLDKEVSFAGFLSFIAEKYQKEIDKVKNEQIKAVKKEALSKITQNLLAHEKECTQVMEVHSLIERVKNRVIDELNELQPIRRFFKDEFGGLKQANVEGYVTYNNHGTTKFVKRSEFSKQNFAQSSNRTPVTEGTQKLAVIVPLGRFNPPHIEHMHLIDATLKVAKSSGGTPIIFVSTKTDNKKNPLTADEKIKYLNKMYPGQPGLFQRPPPKNPTSIGVAKMLSEMGYTDIIAVLGDDRTEELGSLLHRYNHKEFDFNSIKVVPRTSIIPSTGTGDGIHASDLRRWAVEGDFDNMRDSISKKLSDSEVRSIMSLIKNRIKG